MMLLGVASLFCVFLFPLWRITLEAPQFPGGLRLDIWINKFSGDNSEGNILQNINILNHYIGMRPINPDAIPEMRYFPYIVYIMGAAGLLAAALNRAWLYAVWTISLIVLGALGVYDFYLWLYDYGHNLDPEAPIQVPGMVYMPPLLGEKDLLNFYVTSYPRLGTCVLGISTLFGILAFWGARGSQKRNPRTPVVQNAALTAFLYSGAIGLLMTSCQDSPKPLQYGEEVCNSCRMTIADKGFGAASVTTQGRQRSYDALECLLRETQEEGISSYRSFYAVALDDPGHLHPVASLHFIVDQNIKSPMGAHLGAFLTIDSAVSPDPQFIKWDDLINRSF